MLVLCSPWRAGAHKYGQAHRPGPHSGCDDWRQGRKCLIMELEPPRTQARSVGPGSQSLWCQCKIVTDTVDTIRPLMAYRRKISRGIFEFCSKLLLLRCLQKRPTALCFASNSAARWPGFAAYKLMCRSLVRVAIVFSLGLWGTEARVSCGSLESCSLCVRGDGCGKAPAEWPIC